MTSGPALTNPRGIAHETDGTLVVADFSTGSVFRVNRETGERSILSDEANDGPKLHGPAAITVLDDGRIYVADTDLNEVIKIDPRTGHRVSVASGFSAAFGLAAGNIGGRQVLVVSDTGGAGVAGGAVGPVIVDIEGANEVVAIGSGANEKIAYTDPRSVAIDENGDIFIGEMAGGRVIKVTDPLGAALREVVSASPAGAAGQLIGMKLIGSNTLLAVDFSAKAIVKIDVETGQRHLLSDGASGTGIDFLSPGGVEAAGDHIYVTDFGVKAVIEIDATSGDRRKLSGSAVSGFFNLRGLMQLSTGAIAVADFGGERMVSVSGMTGDRTVVSNSVVGQGPHFGAPVSIAELPDRSIAISDFAHEMIYVVDGSSGNRKELSGSTVGTGPTIGARGLILDPADTSRLVASTFGLRAIMAVDIETGERRVLSSASTDLGFDPVGDGIGFRQPLGVSIATEGTIYVSDIGLDAILSVDPDTGNRKIISGHVVRDDDDSIEIGEGPLFGQPFGLTLEDGAKSILVADAALHAVIRVDLETGNREIVSGPDKGTGPKFANPFAVRLFASVDPEGGGAKAQDNRSEIIVSDYGINAVVKVDLASGDRIILSGVEIGADLPAAISVI